MRSLMPVSEINVEEIAQKTKKYREKLLEKREDKLKEKIKNLNLKSLALLANNEEYNVYSPYLLDFKFVLDRIKHNKEIDRDTESSQIKIDIAEQLLKMKKIPSLDTECHIESRKIDNNTSIKSLILKKLFRQRKYRLVFHGREATFENYLYKVSLRKRLFTLACFEIVIFILSFVFSSSFLLEFSIFLMLLTIIIMV